MSGRFDHFPWRKLYCVERGSFAQLPLYTRALAAELLKFCDDDGRIFVGEGEVDYGAVLGRLLGAVRGDRTLLRNDIPRLLIDGYLVRVGPHLVIRNLRLAQGKPAAIRQPSGSEPAAIEQSSSSHRAVIGQSSGSHRASDEQSSGSHPAVNSDPSARNDSSPSLAWVRASEEKKREEESREEEKKDAPDGAGSPSSKPAAGSEAASAPKSTRHSGRELEADEVLAYWASKLYGKRQPQMSKGRRAKVIRQLADGFSVADLKLAVDGCAASEFHRQHGFRDIELICRDAQHVEDFIARATGELPTGDGGRGADEPPPSRTRITPTQDGIPPPPEFLAVYAGAIEANKSALPLPRRSPS